MAKQKKKPEVNRAEKARMEVRFDQDVFDRLKALADEAGVSMNQILHGLARWAGQNGVAGEPDGIDGFIKAKPVPGCLFFGNVGRHWEPGEREAYEEALNKDGGDFSDKGKVIFRLDFTERRVVLED